MRRDRASRLAFDSSRLLRDRLEEFDHTLVYEANGNAEYLYLRDFADLIFCIIGNGNVVRQSFIRVSYWGKGKGEVLFTSEGKEFSGDLKNMIDACDVFVDYIKGHQMDIIFSELDFIQENTF